MMLKIPISAQINWNTFDQKSLERVDQESIFLAVFSGASATYLVDYSYYDRGKYVHAPVFILEVYVQEKEEIYRCMYCYEQYETIDAATSEINKWVHFLDQLIHL
jgi:hypothetical protein